MKKIFCYLTINVIEIFGIQKALNFTKFPYLQNFDDIRVKTAKMVYDEKKNISEKKNKMRKKIMKTYTNQQYNEEREPLLILNV